MSDTIEKDIISIISDNTSPRDVVVDDFDKKLDDYGIDSLDLASILLSIEEKFDFKIPNDDIESLETFLGPQ